MIDVRIRMSRSTFFRTAALALLAFVACESPFEPRGEGERVPVGQEITDDVSGDVGGRYSFVAQTGSAYVVFVSALEGGVALYVTDSAHGFLVANQVSGPGSPPLYENATGTFAGAQGTVYQMRFLPLEPGSYARFTFVVYRINTFPEVHDKVFAVGDTVSGETIDPIVDIDRFFVHGTAGQEFVVVGETQGSPGSGSVAFDVVDTGGVGLLGYVFADAGVPTLTTGRMRFPATRDYRLSASSVISNTYPRYHGPYRFWSYQINRAPEHRAASVPFNSEIGNETIDREGDVDEFTFEATTGAEFNVFVQAPRAFQLELARPGTSPFASATAVPADTALYFHSTGRFSAFQTGTYVLRMSGSGSHQVADTGRYRVYVYAIDRRPEHVPAAIAIGDTVSGEQIELPGDVDEFTFSGTAGEEINAFFQAEDGTQETLLQLELLEPAGTMFRSVQSVGTDTSLLHQATGTMVLPSTGTYRIRVRAPGTFMDRSRGPYRFFLYRINRAPESVPATLALGDSVTGEAIDLPGDVDEFTFTAADTTLAGFALTRTGPPLLTFVQCLRVALVANDSHQILDKGIPQYCGTTTEVALGTGPFTIPGGSHTLRVQGVGSTGAGYTGPYRIVTFPLDSMPEIAADSMGIPDTVGGESLGLPGDYDVFTFSGRKGQHVDVHFQGLATGLDSSQFWFIADIRGTTPPQALAWVSSPASSASLDEHRTRRIDLPTTGVYRLTVNSGHTGSLLDEAGPYRLAIVTVPAAPETAPVTLLPGDSIISERIDSDEDVDEFVLTGSPGQELAVFLFSGETQALTVVVYDTVTGDIIDGTPSFVGLESTGRFRLPASGAAGIRVYSPRPCPTEISSEFGGCGTAQALGSYFLKSIIINRAPENVSGTVVVGDTVSGEAVDPRGDVDEFTVTGTQGQHLIAYLQTPQGSYYPGVVLRVIDTTSGAVLGSVASLNNTPALEDQSTGPIELPYTGAYTIRVEGGSDRYGSGVYRFKVVLQ
ncbi:MAG TPA: hypothetical protein VGQ18_03835 [Gemmatimonadales bacterium]|nr:hypothetical protein [Gemmatimonadales bacterium]